ncbi:MAG: SPOR domain-containing protein [Cyanobacteria bacterium J06597_16]
MNRQLTRRWRGVSKRAIALFCITLMTLTIFPRAIASYANEPLAVDPAIEPAVAPEPCTFFSSPQQFNSSTSEDGTIIIGRQADRSYRVIVPGSSRPERVSAVRACVTDAFVSRTRSGEYLQVGSFDRRGDAETIRRILRKEGYPTRVIYSRQ